MSILPGHNSTAKARGAALALLASAALVSPIGAQGRVPLIGTVAPGAVQPAPPQRPPAIGGGVSSGVGSRVGSSLSGGVSGLPKAIGGIETRGAVPTWQRVIPLYVADAPLIRGGAVVLNPAPARASAPEWYPSAEPPAWRIDSSAPRVDAWRDIIVRDAICNSSGMCLERHSRVRARWSARCSCYIFADGLHRLWRVE